MLHELSHNVHGPHNDLFHMLWDQLRKEYEALLAKGYTGEGFLSDGHKLGGRRVPREEANRIARNAAEKRRTLYSGSGQKLGGAPVRVGTDIRKVIVDAIERRSTVLKGCGSGNKNLTEKEIIDLTDEAEGNGVKTTAEEDEANDRAISQALWDLVQEDEKKNYGNDYIHPTPSNPTGNGGGKVSSQQTIKKEDFPSPQPRTAPSRQPPQHVSRLVDGPKKQPKVGPGITSEPLEKRSKPVAATVVPLPTGWTCPICTLQNPVNFLSCDACTTERPGEITRQLAEQGRKKASAALPTTSHSKTWTCHYCTTVMEDQWWTCATCGQLKESS